jgi:predicted MFS family arabinose efflux permease
MAAVHDRRMALYLYLFFHIFTAFAVLEGMITLYLGKRFDVGPLDVGQIFVAIGVVLFLTQGVLLRRLVNRFSEARLVAAGLFTMACGLAAVAAVPSERWLYLVGPVIAFGNGIAFPSFTSLYSKACAAGQAGELLGQSQSMATTGRIVGPLLGGLAMEQLSLGAPFVISGALMALGLVLFLGLRRTLVEPA